MTSLSQTFELVKQAEFESKLASLQEAWGEDEVRLDLLDQAIDMIKQAQEDGELPELDEAQALELGVALVEDYVKENLEEGAEQTEEVEATEEEAFDISKVASDDQLYDLGQDVAGILAEEGITADDLEKIATEEEADALARWCAQQLAARYESLNEALGN